MKRYQQQREKNGEPQNCAEASVNIPLCDRTHYPLSWLFQIPSSVLYVHPVLRKGAIPL